MSAVDIAIIGPRGIGNGGAPAPTLNLLSATPDGPRGVVLAFDRIPIGTPTLTITSSSGGAIPSVLAALPVAPYSMQIRLTFGTPGTAAGAYQIAVTGLLGPSGEALGTSSASWTAPTPTAVALLSADAETPTEVALYVDQEMRDTAALRLAATYTITPTGTGAAMAVLGGMLAGPQAIRLYVSGGTPGAVYSVTVASGVLVSLDGGLLSSPSNVAAFNASLMGTPQLWTPPGARFSLDGVALETLGLLPEPGEPAGAVLVRAAWLSLLCHRTAGPDDVLPDRLAPMPYRGGWYGDQFAAVDGDEWGSLLWLLYRYRGTDAASKAEEAVKSALAWMVTDGLASSIACTATRTADRLDMSITITRGASTAVLRFDLWGGL